MFATYAKSTMTADTYKEICKFKKQKSNTVTAPLRDISSKTNCAEKIQKNEVKKKQKETTDFQKYYVRGDFPISVSFSGANRALKWLINPDKIDLAKYLPLFLLGLVEVEEPYIFIGEQCSLQAIMANGDKLNDILPDLVLPIKHALDSKDNKIIIRGLNVFQALLRVNKKLAETLIPFYKNLLPAFNRHIHHNLNLGHQTEFSQKKRINVSDLMIETLGLLETNGGADSFANIKYMIPLYQSVKVKPK